MSTSYNCYGFKPPDEKWLKMKEVWDACTEAGVEVPDKVWEFFNGEDPDDAGVEVHLGSQYSRNKNHECCQWFEEFGQHGFNIDISKLPPDVKTIRFKASY